MPGLSSLEPLTLVALGGHLALATIALARQARSRLAAPLALLCLDLFAFNGADAIHHLTGSPTWNLMDHVGASLLAPLAFDFALAFTGRRRGRFRYLARALWGWFGAIALVTLASALGWTQLFGFHHDDRWAVAILPGGLVMMLVTLYLLLRHLRDAAPFPVERARTALVLSAYAVGLVGNFVDLAANAGATAARLGALANFAATLLLATVALGLGLFERRVPLLVVVNGALAGLLQLAVYFVILRYLGHEAMLVAVCAVTLGLAGWSVAAGVRRAARERQQKLSYHATLGRFAEQMAHDLRNPVAAIRGAAQLLEGEEGRGTRVAEVGEYVSLILEQADRIGRVVTDYQRLGRVDPRRAPVDLGQLVASVAQAQALAAPAGVTVAARVAPGLPLVPIDRELVEAALENLVRNAFEAMPLGGTIELRVAPARRGPARLLVEVEDGGPGMDARALEQAFGEFFTTKASGTGLGLSFVRRVAEAHGGTVAIDSRPGRGTTITLALPLGAESGESAAALVEG